MGLDMSLEAEAYIGANYSFKGISGEISLFQKNIGKIDLLPLKYLKSIVFEIGTWTKAHAIHRWFVENVQDREDDCGRYCVSIYKLGELKEICETVLNAKGNLSLAEDLLPTNVDFIYEDEDYIECYYDQIKETIEILSKVDEICDKYDFSFYYSSSW